jgi:hypothetical protein
MKRKLCGVLVALALLTARATTQQTTDGETLFVGGHIYTGGLHPLFVTALLIRGDRILAVGQTDDL